MPQKPSVRAQQPKRSGRVSRHPLLFTVLGVFLAFFALSVYLQANSGITDIELFDQPANPDVKVTLVLKSIEPDKQTAVFSMLIEPQESILAANGVTVQEPLLVQVNNVQGTGSYTLNAGQLPQTETVRFQSEGSPDRSIETWPFDRYTGNLTVQAFQGTVDNPKLLKTQVTIEGNAVGWKMSGKEIPASEKIKKYDPEITVVDLAFTHSASIWVLGLLLILVLISLPVMAIFVALRVHHHKQAFEGAFTGWFAGMLFAVIPIRNFLPGNPPPGSWIDLTVTVWVVIGLTAALMIYIRAWVLRKSFAKQPEKLAQPEPEKPKV